MWYTLPCSPVPRARLFWRGSRASSGAGPRVAWTRAARPAAPASPPAPRTPLAAKAAAPAPTAPAAPAAKPSGVVLRPLTDEEQKARVPALADARLRDAEERKIAEEEAKIRQMREAA